tara:strand:- start:1577 stop:1924 length:348 start_codon:yes stop_codon:yes gene_type:complete
MNTSYLIFLFLIILVAFLLVAVIMVQNPKGGGLSSSFGGSGSQQFGGVKQTTDFLDKSTWYLAATLIALILISNISFTNPKSAESSAAGQKTDQLENSNSFQGITTEDKTNNEIK